MVGRWAVPLPIPAGAPDRPLPGDAPLHSPKYRFQYSAPSGPGSGGLVSVA
jgi:hypothetical protein